MRQKGNESYEGIPTEEVSAALRTLREKWAITQQQMADAMGITKNVYVRFEAGKRTDISLEQFKQGLTIFTREGYKVESVADVLQKSKEPFTWEQILIRDQRTQAAADLRKLSRKRNELAEKSVQGKGVIFVATKEVEKFPRALGRVLRALRDEKELSAEDVAGKLNILPDALLRFETGKMPLSKQRVEAVAAALDTSLGAVLDKLSVERGKSKDDITTEINEYFRASLPAASHADRYAINEEGNSPRRR